MIFAVVKAGRFGCAAVLGLTLVAGGASAQSARGVRIPYDGGPVPPGGRLETESRLGITVGGAATFLVGWAVPALIGANMASTDDGSGVTGGRSSAAWWLAVPLVGPLRYGFEADAVSPSTWALIGFDVFVQGAGLALFAFGIARPTTYVVFDEARRSAPARPRWALLPGSPATPHGATFALTF